MPPCGADRAPGRLGASRCSAAGGPHFVFRAPHRGRHHPVFRVRSLSSEAESCVRGHTGRKWQGQSLTPGGIGSKAVLFPPPLIKQTNSPQKRKPLEAGKEGVPFLKCVGKDLSQEDELPFVFCSPGDVDSFRPTGGGSSLRVHSRNFCGASAPSRALSGADMGSCPSGCCSGRRIRSPSHRRPPRRGPGAISIPPAPSRAFQAPHLPTDLSAGCALESHLVTGPSRALSHATVQGGDALGLRQGLAACWGPASLPGACPGPP